MAGYRTHKNDDEAIGALSVDLPKAPMVFLEAHREFLVVVGAMAEVVVALMLIFFMKVPMPGHIAMAVGMNRVPVNAGFHFAINRNIHMRAKNAALLAGVRLYGNTGKAKPVHLCQKRLLIRRQFQ